MPVVDSSKGSYGETVGIFSCFFSNLFSLFAISGLHLVPRMAYVQSNSPPERDNEQIIQVLKKGAYLLKYGRRGKPKLFPFRLSNDEVHLIWYRGKSEKRLKLSNVSRIIPGQRTAVFRRYPQPEKEYQSFSLIYGGRSLDLICKDKDEAEVWITALRSLICRGNSPQMGTDAGIFSDSCQGNTRRNSNHSSSSNDTINKDQGEEPKASVSCDETPFNRLGKVFSDVLSKTSAGKALFQAESVSKFSNFSSEDLESLTKRSSMGDSFKTTISRAMSSSSLGSRYEYVNSLCDIFFWGEGTGNGMLGGGGIQGTRVVYSSGKDAHLPRVLNSYAGLDAQNLACGTKHAVLVTKQGQVFSWGEESGGRLGHGTASDLPQPKLVNEFGGSTMELAACGEFHTCAVTTSGDLYAWGDGVHNLGLLGLGGETSWWKPVRVLGPGEGVTVKTVSCGSWHTAVVSSDGRLFTFGDGTFGALGHGDRNSTRVPRKVEALSKLQTLRVSCGIWHTAAIVETFDKPSTPESTIPGKLFTWGDGDKGQLGNGDKEPKLAPSPVNFLESVSIRQVACGHGFTIALTSSGQVIKMGIINPNLETTVKLPTRVEDGIGKIYVEDVKCGFHHVAVLTAKAEIYTWGKGTNGQLGHGDNKDRKTPTLVRALKDRQVKKIFCGSNFTAAISLHKPISGADHSKCLGCGNPLNYIKKPHNCYNCGRVFCSACTSKKSLKAAMAPKTNKQFRVCDDCYNAIEGVRESLLVMGNPRTSNASLHSSGNDADDREANIPKSARQLIRLGSFEFLRQVRSPSHRIEESLGIGQSASNTIMRGGSSSRSMPGLYRLTSFDSLKREEKRSKHSSSNSDTASLVRHSVATSVPFSQRASMDMFPMPFKCSPVYSVAETSDFTDTTDSEFNHEIPKKGNQEIGVLKAQVEDLTRRLYEAESTLERTSTRLEEESEKNKSFKEVIKTLSIQLTLQAAGTKSDEPKLRRNSI